MSQKFGIFNNLLILIILILLSDVASASVQAIILPNSTNSENFSSANNGTTASANLYSTNLPFAAIRAGNAISAQNLTMMSNYSSSRTGWHNVTGTASLDERVLVNFTQKNVSSVNWIVVNSSIWTSASDTVMFGVRNYTATGYNLTGSGVAVQVARFRFNISGSNISRFVLMSGTTANWSAAAWSNGASISTLVIDYFNTTINYEPYIVYTPINITGFGNNFTGNNTLTFAVNQNQVVSFNLTTNDIINSNTTAMSSGVNSLGNSSLGSTSFYANFSFPTPGSYYVNLSVWNASQTQDYRNWTITVKDITLPTYVNATPNTTYSGQPVNFSITYNDNTALHTNGQYMFSTNNSGVWVNSSWSNFASTPQTIYNNTLVLNTTVGTIVGYRWYAKDNSGNWNNTSVFSFTTLLTPPTIYSFFWANNTTTTIFGYTGIAASEGLYGGDFPFAALGALSPIDAAGMNNMSNASAASNSWVATNGSSTQDEWMMINWSVKNVSSVNWISINVSCMGNGADNCYLGVRNYTATGYNVTQIPTATGVWGRMNFNISGSNISKFVNIVGTTANWSTLVWSSVTTNTAPYSLYVDYWNVTISYEPYVPPIPMNITSHQNNVTNDTSLSISVTQNANIMFNLTTNMTIDSNSTTQSSNVVRLNNYSSGTTFFANYSFPTAGSQYVNVSVTNTTGGSDYRNWSITVNPLPTYIPPVPVLGVVDGGTDYVNQSWSAGAGNITNSFNYSVNGGSWTNGTLNVYVNTTGLSPGSWANLTVWAWNNSGIGTLSSTVLTNNTKVTAVAEVPQGVYPIIFGYILD